MSRQSRNLVLAFVVMLLALVAVLDKYFHTSRSSDVPVKTAVHQAADFEKYHGRTFAVIKVVDGDTIDLNIPDANYPRTRIRLLGVDAPETKNPKTGAMYFGEEAVQFAKELTLGKTVTIYLDESTNTRGKYGRVLAYVQLPDGQYLNELLLTEGFAYADLRFDHSFYNKYRQLESSARSLGKGLWQNVSREQLPFWMQKRKPHLLKNTQ